MQFEKVMCPTCGEKQEVQYPEDMECVREVEEFSSGIDTQYEESQSYCEACNNHFYFGYD